MYTAKNFEHLIGTEGFSEALLKNHFTLYEGYVTNTNKLVELLDTKEIGTPEYSELQRRLGWEWNGMRMHELYFGNMKSDGTAMKDGTLKQKIEKIYGSVEKWQAAFSQLAELGGRWMKGKGHGN